MIYRKINTNLSDFVMIDKITKIDDKTIWSEKYFHELKHYKAIEFLAQTGAFHLRYINKFNKHVFLLSVSSFKYTNNECLSGKYQLKGEISAKSDFACSYKFTCKIGSCEKITGDFMFALKNYDNVYKKNILKPYYKKVFLCLLNDLPQNFCPKKRKDFTENLLI